MKSFNLRVYGLLINEKKEVLISEERRAGHSFTKFPGGGLEWGEGLEDGLKREFEEELETAIEVGELFYVNDFFLKSAYNENHQLVCFYYFVTCENWRNIQLDDKHFLPLAEDGEKQRWIPLELLSSELMTFPIDKVVADKLRIHSLQGTESDVSSTH